MVAFRLKRSRPQGRAGATYMKQEVKSIPSTGTPFLTS
jgi:hypothetical protein